MQFEKISVQVYSGYKANERPVSFTFRGRQYHVVEIADRWYEGGSGSSRLDYYKIIADDGQSYILRYNALFDTWSIMIPEGY